MLVVIGIIGILVAILLPAVQYAHEAGRRARCVNNLSQMGEAVQSLFSKYGYFPTAGAVMGGNAWSNNNNYYDPESYWCDPLQNDLVFAANGLPYSPDKQTRGFHFQLLPFLDRLNDYNAGAMRTDGKAVRADVQAVADWLFNGGMSGWPLGGLLHHTQIPNYLCPSRSAPGKPYQIGLDPHSYTGRYRLRLAVRGDRRLDGRPTSCRPTATPWTAPTRAAVGAGASGTPTRENSWASRSTASQTACRAIKCTLLFRGPTSSMPFPDRIRFRTTGRAG